MNKFFIFLALFLCQIPYSLAASDNQNVQANNGFNTKKVLMVTGCVCVGAYCFANYGPYATPSTLHRRIVRMKRSITGWIDGLVQDSRRMVANIGKDVDAAAVNARECAVSAQATEQELGKRVGALRAQQAAMETTVRQYRQPMEGIELAQKNAKRGLSKLRVARRSVQRGVDELGVLIDENASMIRQQFAQEQAMRQQELAALEGAIASFESRLNAGNCTEAELDAMECEIQKAEAAHHELAENLRSADDGIAAARRACAEERSSIDALEDVVSEFEYIDSLQSF